MCYLGIGGTNKYKYKYKYKEELGFCVYTAACI